MNELLFLITIILCFSITLLFYKFMGKTGIFIWITLATIMSNIQTIKLVTLFGVESSLGTVLYGSIFLANDILNEEYGKKVAIKTIYIGFAAMLLMTLFMYITLLYIPSASDFANDSLKLIFSLNVRITIGSLLGFFVSQLIDTNLYEYFRKKNYPLWIKNNCSTIISQLIDTILFVIITYIGVVNVSTLFSILISMYIFKFVIAIIDTPFLYIAKKINIKSEG